MKLGIVEGIYVGIGSEGFGNISRTLLQLLTDNTYNTYDLDNFGTFLSDPSVFMVLILAIYSNYQNVVIVFDRQTLLFPNQMQLVNNIHNGLTRTLTMKDYLHFRSKLWRTLIMKNYLDFRSKLWF